MAYHNTSAVVYGKAVRNHSKLAGRLTHQELETAVVLHEMGHLLGLVNKGTERRCSPRYRSKMHPAAGFAVGVVWYRRHKNRL